MRQPDCEPGTLLSGALASVAWDSVAILHTLRYEDQYITPAEASRFNWGEFTKRLPLLYRTGAAGLDLLLTRKSVTWSDRDLNVYIGAPSRNIRFYDDLTKHEFEEVFGWHIDVASSVARAQAREVYVTHGFNPADISPDAHSIATRFHTHVHIPQQTGRRSVRPSELDHFDQLALIEPFADVFFDRALAVLAGGASETNSGSTWALQRNFGFFTLTASLKYGSTAAGLGGLYDLLSALRVQYDQVVEALTTGKEERTTGYLRLVPRPTIERGWRMDEFLRKNAAWLSESSAGLLTYLAGRLVAAEPRESTAPRRIRSAAQLWIAKGYSGVLNFAVCPARSRIRVDFAPRVVSTSGAAKVIHPDGPTLIVKDSGAASLADRERMEKYQAVVVASAMDASRRREGPS